MTKTQAATLQTIRNLLVDGELDVTYGGIKGVNRNSLFCLENMGAINITRTYEGEGNYRRLMKMIATVNPNF